jgi:tRNA U34 5-methylaminomethyl-2-thiouridine-forming methyltransferase MnmC
MIPELEIIITEDGSHTIAVPALNEHYHSVHGAISESKHIFIEAGLKPSIKDKDIIHILEIGFGTGLNTFLTFLELQQKNIRCEYFAVELHPLPEEIFRKLNYAELLSIPFQTFLSFHESIWNENVLISENFILHKEHSSLQEAALKENYFDLVYFDAFGPDKQPDMWIDDVFRKISSSMKQNSILTTYSTKGNVKRILRSCGFSIEKLPGPAGKREMLRAKKI